MNPTVTIRQETPADFPRIREVIKQAFRDAALSDHDEHLLVDRLRMSEAYIPTLALVAEYEGEAAAHIALSRARIVGADSVQDALLLAPLSVHPFFQGAGLGSALVEAALARAVEQDFGAVLTIGWPGFYGRFGFVPASGLGVVFGSTAPTAHEMVCPLGGGSVSPGRVEWLI